MTNEYVVQRPESFEGERASAKNLPVLSIDDNCEYVTRFDYHNVHAMTDSAERALKNFTASAMDKKKWRSYNLASGEVLLFDNHKMLHTRNAFKPASKAKARWLLRVFGVQSELPEELRVSQDCPHHISTA